MPLATLFSNMIISKGRSGTFFWCTFSLGVVQIGLMLVLYPLGIQMMVIAYMLLNTSWLAVWLFFVRRLTGYSLGAHKLSVDHRRAITLAKMAKANVRNVFHRSKEERMRTKFDVSYFHFFFVFFLNFPLTNLSHSPRIFTLATFITT